MTDTKTKINLKITEYVVSGKPFSFYVDYEADVKAKWGFVQYFDNRVDIIRAVKHEVKKRMISEPVYNVIYKKKKA